MMNSLEQMARFVHESGRGISAFSTTDASGRFEVPDVSKDRSKLRRKNRIALHKYGNTKEK